MEGTLGDAFSDAALPQVIPNTPSDVIASLMIAENTGRICVADPESGRLAGIVARRDLLRSRAAVIQGEQDRSRG